MKRIPSDIVRQVLLLAGIVMLGLVLFRELEFFFPALLGAYTLYVLLRKYMFILTGKYKWKSGATAIFLMVLSFLIILLPIMILINMMTTKVTFAVEHSSQVLSKIQQFIQQYEAQWGFKVFTPQTVQKLTDWGTRTLPTILSATLNTLTTVVMMYFLLFFMLTNGRRMETGIYSWMPVKEENVLLIRKEMNSMVLSNAVGIPVIALMQGLVGLLGYWVIGVDEPVFWFVVTSITALLPVVGAALAYVPLGLLLFSNGDVTRGVLVLLYGFIVIGLVDNVFRFWFNKRVGDIHPLITVFGVIVGVAVFGFIGIIFGPILISLFLLLIKIYTSEYGDRSRNIEEVGKPGDPVEKKDK
ncbi:MAG TPA: AI-2E family transporter [Chitinophagaceae bacterium]|nr:AI-2E family transporter [Chitinophagaceae bacterium]